MARRAATLKAAICAQMNIQDELKAAVCGQMNTKECFRRRCHRGDGQKSAHVEGGDLRMFTYKRLLNEEG